MASDTKLAAQILRGHEKRISRLEERDEAEGPASILRVEDDSTRMWEDVTTSTTSTTNTKWDTDEWDQSSSGSTSALNWS